MCSIFGAVGHPRGADFDRMRRLASDRGRDGGNVEEYRLSDMRHVLLGNWRATPTTELEKGRLQPYDGIVHNGTIANAEELGLLPGEIDSEILPHVLNRNGGITIFAHSLAKLVGSYAIAAVAKNTVFLACNYKPLYYYKDKMDDDEDIYFSSMERHLADIIPFGHRAAKLPPYSVLDLTTKEVFYLPRSFNKRAVVIASSGLDSTVAAARLINEGYEVCLLHFDYGCNASTQESLRIPRLASLLKCTYHIMDIPFSDMQGGSSLFDLDSTPKDGIAGAEYAHEWVPARNLIMLSLAAGYAEANGYHYIALGNNLEEAGAYPDNEEEFTYLFDQVLPYATQNGYGLKVLSPVGNLMKHEVVKTGYDLNVPFEYTWSCYKAGAKHCGKCGPCFMRQTAFRRSNIIDPTQYEV